MVAELQVFKIFAACDRDSTSSTDVNCAKGGWQIISNYGKRAKLASRLVEPKSIEGSLLYYGQTLAFGFDKKGQPIQIQNGGLAGWRFRGMLSVVSRNAWNACRHLCKQEHREFF